MSATPSNRHMNNAEEFKSLQRAYLTRHACAPVTYTFPSSSQNGDVSYPSNSKCVASVHERGSKGSSALNMTYTHSCKHSNPTTHDLQPIVPERRRREVLHTLSHRDASSCSLSSSTRVVKIQKVSSSYRSVGAHIPLPTRQIRASTPFQ